VVVQYTYLLQRNDGAINLDDIIDQCVYYAHQPFVEERDIGFYDAHKHQINSYNNDDIQATTIIHKITTKQEIDYISLCLLFGWLSPDIIKKTFENTTQYEHSTARNFLKHTFKSPNPALNVAQRNYTVACDIVYSDAPANNDGYVATVFFVGINSQACEHP
jgi:hypothetical protein